MAQPNAVQDQPSMEDILASIRRIIEEGDTKAPANANAAVDVPEVRAPNGASRTAPSTGLNAEPRTSVRAAPGDIEAVVEQGVSREHHAKASEETSLSALMDIKPETVRVNSPRDAGKYETRFSETDRNAFEKVATVLSASAKQTMESAVSDRQPVPLRTVTDRRQSERHDVLVSRQASRNVSMSFENLSDALSREAGRNLPEIAEDILKPMLSDWLDNNLPSMVERLVRQEIERIARGEPQHD